MFDVDAMTQAAQLGEILDSLGVATTRRRNRRGFELYFKCINPQHNDTDAVGKMSMADEGKYKGLFNCWACPVRGNIIQLIQHFCNIEFHAALVWLESRVGVGVLLGTQSLIYKLRKEKLNYGVKEQEEDLPVYELPANYTQCDMGHRYAKVAERYLRGRGIDEETSKRFQVGVCKHSQIGYCLVIPVWFDGQIRSVFYGQPVDGGEKRYPAGSPQSYIIFNWDAAVLSKQYVMVESVLDVLMLDSLGIRHATACFTNMISDRQLELCQQAEIHAVFPDRDSPRGWDLVDRMVTALDKSLQLVLSPLGKDPGDCEAWEIIDAYAKRQRYCDWEVDNHISHSHIAPSSVTMLKKT